MPPATSSSLNGVAPRGAIEHGDEVALPQPVQAARHQVVHQVVALGDGGKDLIDEALALGLGDGAEAERCAVFPWAFACVVAILFHISQNSRARPTALSSAHLSVNMRPSEMPELPEVETVRRGLAPVLVGSHIAALEARRPDLRFPLPERFGERLVGQEIVGLERRAKYLIAALSGGEDLVMHLGMTGRFTIVRDGGARNAG